MPTTLRFAIAGLCVLTIGLLGVIGINLVRPTNHPAEVATGPAPLMVTYLVASKPLSAGTLARAEDFAPKQMASPTVPSDVIIDTPDNRANLRGSLIRNRVEAGQPILSNEVMHPGDRGFIASVLRPGYRAAAVPVDSVSGVAGLIWPGDHVDVLLTQQMKNAPPARSGLAETILRDVRVIAVDQQMVQGAPDDNSAAGKLARTVTLEVTPEDAQKVALATTMGKLSLSIRSAVGEDAKTAAVTFDSDVSAALSQDTQPQAGAVVRIIDGKDSREVRFP